MSIHNTTEIDFSLSTEQTNSMVTIQGDRVRFIKG